MPRQKILRQSLGQRVNGLYRKKCCIPSVGIFRKSRICHVESVGISADLSIERAELASPECGGGYFSVKDGKIHLARLITNSDARNAEAVLLHSRIRIADIRAYRSSLPLPQLGNFAGRRFGPHSFWDTDCQRSSTVYTPSCASCAARAVLTPFKNVTGIGGAFDHLPPIINDPRIVDKSFEALYTHS